MNLKDIPVTMVYNSGRAVSTQLDTFLNFKYYPNQTNAPILISAEIADFIQGMILMTGRQWKTHILDKNGHMRMIRIPIRKRKDTLRYLLMGLTPKNVIHSKNLVVLSGVAFGPTTEV